MSSNIETNEHEGFLWPRSSHPSKRMSWSTIVEKEVRKGKLKVKKCSCYSTPSNRNLNVETKCICGRLAREHSFRGEPQIKFQNAKKWTPKLATLENVTVYGELRSGARVCKSLIIILYNN
jgi:hypothetical protein